MHKQQQHEIENEKRIIRLIMEEEDIRQQQQQQQRQQQLHVQQQQTIIIATSSSSTVEQEKVEENDNDDDDDDWEEWDGSSPFWIHCTAGSIAGVIEHTATYPLDTVRTHIQVCAACIQRATSSGTTTTATTISSAAATTGSSTKGVAAATTTRGVSSLLVRSAATTATAAAATTSSSSSNLPLGMWQTIRYLVNESLLADAAATASRTSGTVVATNTTYYNVFIQGWGRLWRGVQTVLIGCIPAHALYFSSYEFVKQVGTSIDESTGKATLSPIMSSAAGAVATFGHDIIMTPLDTIKQRMQLGHYNSIWQAVRSITKNEGGYSALYRSFPVTLASNLPYGMIMVTTNETCKSLLLSYHQSNSNDDETRRTTRLSFMDVVISSSIAGFVASAITTPLDRIKTALQTQQLAPNCKRGRALASCYQQQQQQVVVGGGGGSLSSSTSSPRSLVVTKNWYQAVVSIYTQEGVVGFFRGFTPRVLSHTPAVAISWTTYETVKQYLLLHTTTTSNNYYH